MLKVNKKMEYALISLKHISHNKRAQLVSAKEISLTYAIPFDLTSRVLQKMAQKGWVKSEQGPSGGYSLGSKPLNTLSLLDLIEALDGPHAVVKCILHSHDCPVQSKCNLVSPMEKLNSKLKVFLAEQMLDEVIDVTNYNERGSEVLSV